MNATETARICDAISRLKPAQRFDEQTPAFWALALTDVAYEDAKRAVISLAVTERFIDVGDVVAEVRKIRAERMQGVDAVVPSADPDDVQEYLAELRQIRSAAASGDLAVQSAMVGPADPDRLRKAIEAAAPRPEQALRERERAQREAEETERARQIEALAQAATDA